MELILWSLLANVFIVFTEWWYRFRAETFISALPVVFIPILIAQYSLFRMFHAAEHWLVATIFFTIFNSLLRMGISQFVGDPISLKIVFGIIAMLVAVTVVRL